LAGLAPDNRSDVSSLESTRSPLLLAKDLAAARASYHGKLRLQIVREDENAIVFGCDSGNRLDHPPTSQRARDPPDQRVISGVCLGSRSWPRAPERTVLRGPHPRWTPADVRADRRVRALRAASHAVGDGPAIPWSRPTGAASGTAYLCMTDRRRSARFCRRPRPTERDDETIKLVRGRGRW
jgi:hypothetical protein